MNNRIILGSLFVLIGIPAAMFLGQMAVTDPVIVAVIFVIIFGAVLLYTLGKHVWCIIPICAMMKGNLNFLPGNPDPWQMATIIVGGLTALTVLTGTRKIRLRWGWLEIVVALQVVALAQAYLRNPTGLSILGGGVVGGKFYLDYAVAIVAFFLLSIVETTPQVLKKVIYAMVIFGLGDAILKAVASYVPAVGLALWPIYGAGDAVALLAGPGQSLDIGETRLTSLSQLGGIGMLVCCSFWRPMASFHPGKPHRLILWLVSMAAILLSGFRGVLVRGAANFMLGSLVRKKGIDVAIASVGVFLLLVGIIGGGQLRKMPFGLQRALSFMPVDVSPEAREDAMGSSDWRFEMWELALTSDRYIKNKMLGDGFGYSAVELEFATNMLLTQGDFGGIDTFLAKGSYHGFHVETIRFTGVFGLVLATLALTVFSVKAWRVMKAYRNTPEWGAVIFLCIPLVLALYWYWLVFGSYKNDFPTLIVMAGMLKVAAIAHQSRSVEKLDSDPMYSS